MSESLSEENRALVERVGCDGETINGAMRLFPAALNRLLDAARKEGWESGTTIEPIKTAELCFGLGWSGGYESALKGLAGQCMPQAWAESPARALAASPQPDHPRS